MCSLRTFVLSDVVDVTHAVEAFGGILREFNHASVMQQLGAYRQFIGIGGLVLCYPNRVSFSKRGTG